ncbi:MAG TPA: nucleoside monophosphate kinase, partial [Candidatus Acidoferrum sp.]|nr:nucleoside monophosphate kinase [Candidatus Acidoferrum sp.]
VHLSTGDMLREAVRKGTPLGKKAEGFMAKGELVPDELIVGLIEAKVSDGELSHGFVLDGFPRTIPQAESLKQMLTGHEMQLDRAVLFMVSDEEVVRRLSGRWHCPVCQTGYNYPSQMPNVAGKCDKDNAVLQRRPDDDENVVRNRLGVYKRQTAPIVDYYRKESILSEIPGEGHPDTVYQALLKAVDLR